MLDCLESIYENRTQKDRWQILVVDNASTDKTIWAVKKRFPQVETIVSKKNLGFSAGNNLAIPHVKANYVLFLNPDTLIKGQAIQKSLVYLKKDPRIGALSCKVELPDGRLDYSCHRGLPTPWNAFCHFAGLSKLFPHQKIFSGYTAAHLNPSTTHEINCISGTFFLVRKIVYFAQEKIIHYKGSSSGLWGTAKTKVPREVRIRMARSAIKAMRIFVEKHSSELGIKPVMWSVWLGIFILEKIRLLIVKLGLKYA